MFEGTLRDVECKGGRFLNLHQYSLLATDPIGRALLEDDTPTFRPARGADAKALTALAQRSKGHWGYPEAWMEAWQAALTFHPGQMTGQYAVLVAADGQLLGFYGLESGEGGWQLEHCWVDPQSMGSGHGRRLVEHALAVVRGLGANTLTVESDPSAMVQSPEPAVVAPRVLAPEKARSESTGQIYRCGNTYSNAPCEGGQQIAQQSSRPVDRSETKEIYLCKDFQDRLTWESVPCSANGRFMDRIARVPAHVSWEEQVAIARQQRDKAHAIAAEQVVPVASRSVSSTPSECQMIEQHIRALDAECRVNACGMKRLDDIRAARKEARDRQFRIGC